MRMTLTNTQKRYWKGVALVLLAWGVFVASVAYADNIPSPGRGHMGCVNTAAVGMLPVGDGTGFCEQAMPEDCPLSFDGADVICSTGAGSDFNFAFVYEDMPADGGVRAFPFLDAVTCADDFAGSSAKADTASTGTAVFTVKKNAVTVGTVTFTASAIGVWVTSGGATSFAIGDIISVVTPSPQDATLAGVGLTFGCTQ